LYLSCGPESLARDLAELCGRAGFRVRAVQPVDLMPGTPQVETLAVLIRT
jgi:23S rRNA (uracil1939-C5)-methyltransferase